MRNAILAGTLLSLLASPAFAQVATTSSSSTNGSPPVLSARNPKALPARASNAPISAKGAVAAAPNVVRQREIVNAGAAASRTRGAEVDTAAIAVTSVKRDPVLPDTVSMIEVGFAGFDLGNWVAIVGPAGMPKDVVARLNAEIVKILREPAVLTGGTTGAHAGGSTTMTSSSDLPTTQQ